MAIDHQQVIKMDDLPPVAPPRPAIRQRQKVIAAAQSINTDNNDLPQAKLASQDRQVFDDRAETFAIEKRNL